MADRLTAGHGNCSAGAVPVVIKVSGANEFVDVIRAGAKSGQHDHRQLKVERQHQQVQAKLDALMEMWMDRKITPDPYAAKRTN